MPDAADPPLVQGSREQREDAIRTAGGINRARLRVADSLAPHGRAYRLARAAHIAYGRAFGFAHMLPNAYIIGFAKCGTTSLYSHLAEHPQIHPAFAKEAHYFDHGGRYARGEGWYRSNFPLSLHKALSERIRRKRFLSIDATARYAIHPHAARRIKALTPGARLIALVRDPVERAYSHHNMNATAVPWVDEKLPFGEAIEAEESRTAGEYERMERDEGYHSDAYFEYGYAEHGQYARWLRPWFDEFPGRVLVLESAELEADAQAVLDKATDFLGIARHGLRDARRRNRGSYAAGQIDAKTRERLAEYYRRPNAELYDLLGRDLGWG